MLLKGLNHVATITNDADRLQAFYRQVFDAEILRDGSEFPEGRGPRLSIIKIGEWAELNVFQIEGNTEADRQTPMFGRGRIDHLALQAASLGTSRPSGSASWTGGRPTTSSPTSGRC
jgi:catechol 2,3-dioxygenase-like lactoylglutathione lyase family enzyme